MCQITCPVTVNFQAGSMSEERRYCYASGRCTTIGGSSPGLTSARGELSPWSSCSRECGGGRQYRVRSCGGEEGCVGSSLVEQPCNTEPCPGLWGCWAEWGGCQGGRRSRSRKCSDARGGGGSGECGGESRQEEPCSAGVGVWGSWSLCMAGEQRRERQRATGGVDREVQGCQQGAITKTLPRQEEASINLVVGACIIGFILGSCLGSALVFYYFKYKKPNSVTSGHNYISAKSQNLYVSLPMLDLKHKTLSSKESDYGGTLRSNNGTLRSSKGGSSVYGRSQGQVPEEQWTATIKRSHSRRDSSMVGSPGIRADLDSDQLFH